MYYRGWEESYEKPKNVNFYSNTNIDTAARMELNTRLSIMAMILFCSKQLSAPSVRILSKTMMIMMMVMKSRAMPTTDSGGYLISRVAGGNIMKRNQA